MQDALKRIAGRKISTETYERFVARAALEQKFPSLWRLERDPSLPALWDHCVREIGADRRVLFLEFGVFKGTSARYFLERLKHPETAYFGFDSFEGLPEQWGTMAKGTFDVGGNIPDVGDSRARFVKGWFQNTFEKGIRDAKAACPNPEAVFVHFDADLYSSTLFLLCQLYNHFDGYHFLFDELPGHEARALMNFQQGFGAKAEFLGYAGGELPTQVFGKLDNRKGRYEPDLS